MDIQRKAFESSNNVNPDWSFKFDEELQQYVATDFEMTNQVDEFNEHWDTFRAGWQAAKAQAAPEGFVLMPKEPTDEIIEAMNEFDYRNDYSDMDGAYRIIVETLEKAQEDAERELASDSP